MTWADLGARSRGDYVDACHGEWDDQRASLDAREIELALDVCEDGEAALAELDCDALRALYAP